jgi:hypothetical protein
MKSVVVEIKNDIAAVLSDDGSIVKVKNKNYVIGQVIEMKTNKIHFSKKAAICVATLAIMLLGSGAGVWAYTSPYSYVSLDVNPSIEYTVNRFDRVIDVEAVNEDGQAILDQMDSSLVNASLEDAIAQTVDQIAQDGYFGDVVADTEATVSTDATTDTTVTETNAVDTTTTNASTTDATTTNTSTTETTTDTNTTDTATIPVENAETSSNSASGSAITIDGGIVIAVSNEDSSVSEDIADELTNVVTDVINENVENPEAVEIEVTSVAYERVQEAKSLGITPGKLNLIQKLQASSSNPEAITVEDWMHKPVKEIMKAIKNNRNGDAAQEDETSTDATQPIANTEDISNDTTSTTGTNTTDIDTEASDTDTVTVEQEDDKETAKQQKEDAKEATKQQKEATKEQKEDTKEATKKQKEDTKEATKKQKEDTKEAAKKQKEDTKEAVKKQKEDTKEATKKQKEDTKNSTKQQKENAKSNSKTQTYNSSNKQKDSTTTTATTDTQDNSSNSQSNGNGNSSNSNKSDNSSNGNENGNKKN